MIRKLIFLILLILGFGYWYKDTVIEVEGNQFTAAQLYQSLIPYEWLDNLQDVEGLKKQAKQKIADSRKHFEGDGDN
ncbi:MAG: hypothetical protein ACI9S8_003262 [Chlamydiales bacterium]|jgi:hypothetical protein